MKYSVKQIDGEWCVVDKDTDDIVADATDRKDAVLQASALNREESNSESKPKFHRGSSYGNKPEAELSEGPVSDGIDKAIDLMYELTDDGQMAKNAYHDAKAKFKLGRTEAEVVLDIWNDSHKSDGRNFIEVDTINESSGEKQYKVIFKRNQKGFSSSGMGSHAHLTREETISANDWDDAKEQILAMMEPGEFVSTLKEIDPVSDEVRSNQVVKAKKDMDSMNEDMEESQEINELSKKTLGSYVKKATTNVSDKNFIAGHRRGMLSGMGKGDGRDKHGDDLMGKADKRKKSINLAVNKLTKESEEIEIDEAGRTPKEVDEVAVRELVLYAENDADLYRQSASPIIANLQRKVKKGTYDAELAIKLWRYHADRAAKKYIQEFDGEFSPATRNAAAKEFRDGYDEEVQSVLDESSIEEANGKEQLTPELAKGILNDLEIEGKDFFTLSSSKVHELLDVAKQYGYKKSKNAPGSTARMFHQYIERLAKKAKGEEINELSKDTLGSYVKKAAFDNGLAGFRQGKAVGDAGKYHKRPDNATANAEAKRGEKRMKGIDRAVKKLTNESQEEINESFERKMTREIAYKIIRDDLGISNYTHDYQFTQLSLDQIMKLSKLAKEYGFKLDRMAPLSLEATFWKSLQYVIKTGRSIGGNNENESQEEINELSKKTLGSYVKNASADASRHAVDARTNFDRNNKRSADQSLSNNLKRVVGISKAVNKLTKESEEINESFSKLTDKQLQDKFIELKVKAKDLSKDSKESKQLQKIRDEIKKRKDSPKQEIKESLSLEDTIISIIKS